MQVFQQLGALIEQRWRARNYDHAVFADLAAAALDELPPHAYVNAWDIVRWVTSGATLPRQADIEGRFGNPPITLFAAPRFHIDVYFWLDGTTSIHQHAFSGAFQLLLGSSLHSRYEFAPQERVNDHLLFGRLRFCETEILQVGKTRRILSGNRFIHSLFHLDNPSATVTVRTYQDVQTLPQWDYLKPFVARDPFFHDEAASKQLQTVALLLAMKHANADVLIGELLAACDFQTAFAVLQEVFTRLTGDSLQQTFQTGQVEERFAALLARARARHGGLLDYLPPVFAEFDRQTQIVSRRQYITDSEHRFFLALLLNVPDRQHLLELTRQRFADTAPIDKIGGWLDELATTRLLGSREANVLGLGEFDEDHRYVFQRLLTGHSPEEIGEALGADYAPADAEELRGEVAMICERLRNSPLFRELLRQGSRE